MKATVSAHLCLAGVLAAGLASAQARTQQSATSDESTTVTGCVVSESEYRKAHDDGRGGVAGTGIGAGNEFILTEASSASSRMPSATGTSGTTASGTTAYELTGPGEGQLSRYVGHRVELTGKFKTAETNATGQPTGGPTAGAPPRGVDVMSKDLKLREFEVASAKEASGTCSTVK